MCASQLLGIPFITCIVVGVTNAPYSIRRPNVAQNVNIDTVYITLSFPRYHKISNHCGNQTENALNYQYNL